MDRGKGVIGREWGCVKERERVSKCKRWTEIEGRVKGEGKSWILIMRCYKM